MTNGGQQQAGLVALDGEKVVRAAAAGQVSGMVFLGVQGVGGHHGAMHIHPVQRGGEHQDLVGLGIYLHLAQDSAVAIVEGCQQVTLLSAAGVKRGGQRWM